MTWRNLVLISAAAVRMWAVPMDLAPPAASSSLAQFISDTPGDSRGVLMRANSASSIGGAGIRFDPLAGGLTSLRFSVFSVTGSAGAYALGGVLATADAAVSDVGLAFYDVPMSFLMNAGSLYYLSFSNPLAEGWGNGRNEMEFFDFDAATSAPFTAGAVDVMDGGAFPSATLLGFGNSVMPHLRLLEPGAITGGDVAAKPTAVPEPSAAGMLLAAAGVGYLRKRARSTVAILASSSRLRRSV